MIAIRQPLLLAAMTTFASVTPAQQAPSPLPSDVKAEARTAVKSGATAEGELKTGGASAPSGRSERTRTEVKNEARAAVKSGEALRTQQVQEGYETPASGLVGKSRGEVRGAAKAAVRRGATAEGETGDAGREKTGRR